MKSRPQRQKIYLIVFALVVAFVIGFIFLRPRTPIPTYEGISADVWLGYGNNTPYDGLDYTGWMNKQLEAFEKMGTNGVRFLVERMGRSENKWTQFYRKFWASASWVGRYLPRPTDRDEMANMASMALEDLARRKADANPAETYKKVVMLLNHRNTNVRCGAAAVTARYVICFRSNVDFEQSRPALLRALKDRDARTRLWAGYALAVGGQDGPQVVQALSPDLTNSYPTNFYPDIQDFARQTLNRLSRTNGDEILTRFQGFEKATTL